jgi:hypothetical protein
MMEMMGDLLERIKEFASHDITKDEAQKLFGWDVKEIAGRRAENSEEQIIVIDFANGLFLYIRYFLNLDPTESEDTCEFTLGLRNDLRSRIKYNIYYSVYIHGQGYIRVRIAETDNRIAQRMLEDFYIPALRDIYKPIITRFKGFYSKDYFGVEANNNHGGIYYSPVRYRSEQMGAKIWDVVGRLHELDALVREKEIRRALAELDVKLSLLPSVVWSNI